MATTVHHGPYEQMPSAYHALTGWIAGHGHEIGGHLGKSISIIRGLWLRTSSCPGSSFRYVLRPAEQRQGSGLTLPPTSLVA